MLSHNEIVSKSVLGTIRNISSQLILTDYINRIGGSRGLLYIGANTGQELPFCKTVAKRIYAFEPIGTDSVWGNLIKHCDEKTFCFNYALSDTNEEITMHLSSNNYESSSMFEPGNHIEEYPWVVFRDQIKVQTKKLDDFDFVKDCDTIVMDTQGAELRILNGLSDYDNIKLIVTEFCSHNLYKNACVYEDLESKLSALGFKCYEIFDSYYNQSSGNFAGNAIFLKS